MTTAGDRNFDHEFLTLHEFVDAARAQLDDNGWSGGEKCRQRSIGVSADGGRTRGTSDRGTAATLRPIIRSG